MAVTYGAVRVLESVSSILLLIGVAFFLALGLEPAASWFVNRKLPRWAATTLVFVILLALLGAFVAAAVPPFTQQAGELINQAPHYIQQAQDHSSAIGRLNERLHLQQRITAAFNSSGGSIVADAVSAGAAVFGFLADTLFVIVLTVYFLIDMPRIRTSLYRPCHTLAGPARSSSAMRPGCGALELGSLTGCVAPAVWGRAPQPVLVLSLRPS